MSQREIGDLSRVEKKIFSEFLNPTESCGARTTPALQYTSISDSPYTSIAYEYSYRSTYFSKAKKWLAILVFSLVLLTGCELSGGQEGVTPRTDILNASAAQPSTFIENPQIDSQRERLLVLINQARAAGKSCGEFGYMPPVETLTWNHLLENSASDTVTAMAAGDYFDHVNPLTQEDGGSRIGAVGYSYVRWGENLDAGYSTPEAAMIALLDSPTHCQIIMRSYWKEVAWFRRETPEHSTYRILGTQHFGLSQ